MTESTNCILFALVIMLFALVIALVSTGWGVMIGLVGLGFGLYGLYGKAIAAPRDE